MIRAAAIAAAAALVLWGLWSSWQLAARSPGLDFYQFWIGGQEAPHERATLWSAETRSRLALELYNRAMMREGSERMAAVAQARRELDLFSTPFLYTCFGALPNRYEPAYLIWRILSLLSLVAAIGLIARVLGWSLVPALFFLAFVLLLFQPLKSELRVGNVNEIQLLMIAAYFYFAQPLTPASRTLSPLRGARGSSAPSPRLRGEGGRRPDEGREPAIRGAILGVAIAFKPNIAIALPLLIAYDLAHDKRILARELAGVAAGGAAAVAISSAYFRSAHAWIDWLRAAGSLSKTGYPRDIGNVAPALLLGSAGNWALAAILTIAAAFLLVRSRNASPELAVSLGLVIYLLTASLVWLHYLLLAIPLCMILLRSSSMLVQGVAGVAMTLIAADPWDVILRVQSERGEALLITFGLAGLCAAAVVYFSPFSSAKWLRKT